jgi:lipopolysaccharide/colanic/teichoic acid biosynthesis glycosyltransferase
MEDLMVQILSNLKYPKNLKLRWFLKIGFPKILGDMTKRVFDVLAALGGLIILSPVFLAISMLIKRDSPGPVFYYGPRAGKNGVCFRILKFRTMYESEDSYKGPRVTCKDDNRITPFGHWLRDTKINELPQLWNVLIGEMSMVGPRPEDFEIAGTWPSDVRREVLSVRPGITSPASILYHDEEELLSTSNVMNDYLKNILPDKIRLDRLYVRNRSFLVDLDTIFWTIAILAPRIVKSRISEGYIFSGPLTRLVSRHLVWFFSDLIVSLGAAVTSALLWRIQEPLNWGIQPLIAFSVLLAFLFGGINSLAGLNQIVWSEALTEDGIWLALSAGFVTVFTCFLNYLQARYELLPYPALPMTMIFTIGLMASIGFVVTRYRFRLSTGFASGWVHKWLGSNKVVEKVLIVGSGEGYQTANWLLTRGDASRLISIIGVVDDENPAMLGMRLKGNRVLGASTDLEYLIEKFDVGVILLAVPNVSSDFIKKIENVCTDQGVRLVMLTDLLETLHKQLTLPVKQYINKAIRITVEDKNEQFVA